MHDHQLKSKVGEVRQGVQVHAGQDRGDAGVPGGSNGHGLPALFSSRSSSSSSRLDPGVLLPRRGGRRPVLGHRAAGNQSTIPLN